MTSDYFRLYCIKIKLTCHGLSTFCKHHNHYRQHKVRRHVQQSLSANQRNDINSSLFKWN